MVGSDPKVKSGGARKGQVSPAESRICFFTKVVGYLTVWGQILDFNRSFISSEAIREDFRERPGDHFLACDLPRLLDCCSALHGVRSRLRLPL